MATKNYPTSITQNGRTIYLNNKELLAEYKASQEKGEMSNTFAKMLQLLCSRYAMKGSYSGYSYNQDMQAYAMMMIVRTWKSFNPEVSSNPFAFYTQCIKNSFSQYLKHEKKHRVLRDKMMIAQGLNPSFGFNEDGSDRHYIEDEQDFDTLSSGIERQQKVQFIDAPIERDENGREIIDQEVAEMADELAAVELDDADSSEDSLA
jgi:DNA-directed RNA polymerase specialized sigma subunit